MRSIQRQFLLLAALATPFTGCNAPPGRATVADEDDDTASAHLPLRATEHMGDASEGASLAEQGHKLLERGGDPQSAKSAFEAALADPTLVADEKDDARLGLSQAYAALGDQEKAVDAVEVILKAHAASSRFPARDAAEKQLRKLLTGSDSDSPSFSESERYAPVARALAPYFTPDEHDQTLIDVYVFGDKASRSEELGIFNIGAAKRDLARSECALCDTNLHIARSISRSGSWTSIPVAMGDAGPDMPQIDRSLDVFLFDLDGDRIPARYDAYLPIPSAEIVAHLERGEGLIAMREREGAKPTIVIAAPRVGQLGAVEEAFSKLTTLPKSPLVVPVSSGLTADEVASSVRSGLSAVRKCYTGLLAKDPEAAGSITLELGVGADGTVTDARVDPQSTVKDAEFGGCVIDAANHFTFPKSGGQTTVRYPLTLKPGSR